MLNFSKVFFFALVLFAVGCGGDDEMITSTPTASELEGTWSAISLNVDSDGTTVFSGMTTTSTTTIVGNNLNYNVTFGDTDWTTNGSYEIAATASVDGTEVTNTNDSYDNVSGNGTYTTSGTTMTVNGSFFDFEVNGQPVVSSADSQEAEYEINADGNLVFTQEDTSSTDTNGIVSTTTFRSVSVWEKQ